MQSTQTLMILAAWMGLTHTLAGPDHYIPFIAMARAGRWSFRKTLVVTVACGLGHVFSSVLLGALGVALASATLDQLEWLEGRRGELAGYMLFAFGLAYLTWGLRRATRSKRHTHWHRHADGTEHQHPHGHEKDHAHVHEEDAKPLSMTPWILFTIFVLGPCEPLIPLLMLPAAALSVWSAVAVTGVFLMTTVGVMVLIVSCATLGLRQWSFTWLERYRHATAGAALSLCGLLITLGL